MKAYHKTTRTIKDVLDMYNYYERMATLTLRDYNDDKLKEDRKFYRRAIRHIEKHFSVGPRS